MWSDACSWTYWTNLPSLCLKLEESTSDMVQSASAASNGSEGNPTLQSADSWICFVFSRMHSKGSRFTVFARRCACVRNRSREAAMAVPNAAKVVTFEGFKRVVTCLAGVALCDFRTCFI